MNPGIAIRFGCLYLLLWLAAGGASAQPLNPASKMQFDLFPGFNGIIGESAWFPAVFELKNETAPFKATIELLPGGYGGGQNRRISTDLPSGSLKRVTIPAFCGYRYSANWQGRLIDDRGRLRAEAYNALASQNQSRLLNWKARLLGALPRSMNGTPVMAKPPQKSPKPVNMPPGLMPLVARLNPAMMPDNPILLERLDAIYLNSERAADLKEPQVKALLAWLHAGGHLIVGVEAVPDVNGLAWLREIMPVTLTGNATVKNHGGLMDWLRQPMRSSVDSLFSVSTGPSVPIQPGQRILPSAHSSPTPASATEESISTVFASLEQDASFEQSALQIAAGELRPGGTVLSRGDGKPLIVTGDLDRGRVTALMFSPEREPARSWEHLPVMWARLLEVPEVLFQNKDIVNNYEPGSDGIFGALIDSRQVHKLPVTWLLLLLVVYLAVIGPLDRWWLKKINRPMLTWLTFPAYVLLFSVMIYFIGFKLRAGQTEWTELSVVDVFSQGERAQLRGRTYASVYSPANQTYPLTNSARFATIRGEFMGGGSQEKGGIEVMQSGDSFRAEMSVPVWMNQMCVSDWWQPAAKPLTLSMREDGGEMIFTVQNLLDRRLDNAWIAHGLMRYEVGQLRPGERKELRAGQMQSRAIASWVAETASKFPRVLSQRQSTFGDKAAGWLDDAPVVSSVASFLSQSAQRGNALRFVSPPGLDLSPLLSRGQAVLLAWSPDYSPIQPLNQFNPSRSHRDTLWRVSAGVEP